MNFQKTIFLFLFIAAGIFNSRAQDKKFKIHTVAFYNVENLFDTIKGPNYDEEYLILHLDNSTSENNNYIRFDFCLVDQPIIENDECVSAIDIPVTPGFCLNTVRGDLSNATTSPGLMS